MSTGRSVDTGDVIAGGGRVADLHGARIDGTERVTPAVADKQCLLIGTEAIALGLLPRMTDYRRKQGIPRSDLCYRMAQQVHAKRRLAVLRQRKKMTLDASGGNRSARSGIHGWLLQHKQRRLLFTQCIKPVLPIHLQPMYAIEGRQVYGPYQFGRANIDLEERMTTLSHMTGCLHAIVADKGMPFRTVCDKFVWKVRKLHWVKSLSGLDIVQAIAVRKFFNQYQGISSHSAVLRVFEFHACPSGCGTRKYLHRCKARCALPRRSLFSHHASNAEAPHRPHGNGHWRTRHGHATRTVPPWGATATCAYWGCRSKGHADPQTSTPAPRSRSRRMPVFPTAHRQAPASARAHQRYRRSSYPVHHFFHGRFPDPFQMPAHRSHSRIRIARFQRIDNLFVILHTVLDGAWTLQSPATVFKRIVIEVGNHIYEQGVSTALVECGMKVTV